MPASPMPSTMRLFPLLVVALLLPAPEAEARRNGPPRHHPIDRVVLHSTGGPTCDPATGQPIWVGAGTLEENLRHIEAHPTLGIHYMIDRDGRVRSSVPENRIAHHVIGHSGRSLAVELINDGDGIDPFPPAQLDALTTLLRDLARRHRLTRDGIVRHSDLDQNPMPCAPERRRKVDPGAAYPHQTILDRIFPPAAAKTGR